MDGRLERILRVLAPIARWRYVVIGMVAFGSCAQHLRGTGEDWHYFVKGNRLLLGTHPLASFRPGGLHLYANYPELQIGPLSFLVNWPMRMLGPDDGRVAACFLMTAVILLLVFVLERTAGILLPSLERADESWRSVTVLLGGIMVAQAWIPLSTIYAHLDDVLTLSAGVFALWAVANRRPVLLGALIGAAAAAKPWGIVILPLAFAVEGRERFRAVGMAAAVILVAWLPFALGDIGTLHAVTPQIGVDEASVLHLLGVPYADAPTWVRPVQILAALAVGGLAVIRHRWAAVLMLGVAMRIALDPEVFLYYSSGLILGAFAWDLLRSRSAVPVWTFATFVLLNNAYVVFEDPDIRAVLRLAVVTTLAGVALFAPRARHARVQEKDTPACVEAELQLEPSLG